MRGDRGEQPGELGVLAHVGLAKEDAALRVEPGGDQDRGRVVEALAQLRRLVGDRDRVQVDDAVDRLAAVLALDVLADRADVVAEVLAPGRLDAAEDPHPAGLYEVAGTGLGSRSLGRPHSPAVAAAPGPRSRLALGPALGVAHPEQRDQAAEHHQARCRSACRGERPTPRSRRARRRARSASAGGSAADVAAGERLRLGVVDRLPRLGAEWRARPTCSSTELENCAETIAPSAAIASSPATRATALLTPDADPRCGAPRPSRAPSSSAAPRSSPGRVRRAASRAGRR